MSSAWGTYSVVFLGAGVFILIPLLLHLVSFLFSRFSPRYELQGDSAQSLKSDTLKIPKDTCINVRFFSALNIALVLITLVLILVPLAATFHFLVKGDQIFFRGFSGVLFISTLLGVAVFYSTRKGDLSWLKTFRRVNEREQ